MKNWKGTYEMRTKSIKRKVSNLLLLVILIAIVVGIYYNIYNSRAENIIEIAAVALDNYGYLSSEEFTLEAKKNANGLYEIELPESVNTKKVGQVYEISIEDTSNPEAEKEVLLAENNIITISEEQLTNKKINITLAYDIEILTQKEDETFEKNLLSEKTLEEIKELEITEDMQLLYGKILKYEDEENGKLVEVRGYLPKDAELQVTEVSKQDIQNLLEGKTVNVAYDITIRLPITKEDGTIEYQEINPEDFSEKCEVTIKDAEIEMNSEVYHIKEDNTVEQVEIKDNTEENVTFEATNFSVYAVVTEEQADGNELEGNTSQEDTTPPTITVNPTSVSASDSVDITITANDTGSGLAASNTYQYALIPTSLLTIDSKNVMTNTEPVWEEYTSGEKFTIGEGQTGTSYLFVKAVTDNNGNSSYQTTSDNSYTLQVNTGNKIERFRTHMFGEYDFVNGCESSVRF